MSREICDSGSCIFVRCLIIYILSSIGTMKLLMVFDLGMCMGKQLRIHSVTSVFLKVVLSSDSFRIHRSTWCACLCACLCVV